MISRVAETLIGRYALHSRLMLHALRSLLSAPASRSRLTLHALRFTPSATALRFSPLCLLLPVSSLFSPLPSPLLPYATIFSILIYAPAALFLIEMRLQPVQHISCDLIPIDLIDHFVPPAGVELHCDIFYADGFVERL